MKRLIAICFFSCLTVLALFIAGFLVYSAIMLLWTKENATVQQADAIIVLTGSKYRIEGGFELLLEEKAPRLLISGVTEGVTFDEIIDAREMETIDKDAIRNHCCIELDYVADTTETNASESANWIRDNNIQSIILVTSYAHMPRALLQFIQALPETVTIQTYPVRRERRWTLVMSYDFWIYAGREYLKYLASWISLEMDKQ